MVIVPATKADIPAIVQLVNSAYRGEESKKGWTTEADLLTGTMRTDERTLVVELEDPSSLILLCRLDPEATLAGCVYLQKRTDHLYLGMLSVSPLRQAQGIGKALLAAANAYAQTHHYRCIRMTVISVRHELIAWYERHGFKATGQILPFPDEHDFGIPTRPLEFAVLEKKW